MFFDTGMIAERKIQEAIEEGKFDNLPGKGKPIDFDDDPSTPPHLRLANRILKNAGVLPDWMQIEREIESGRSECAALWGRVEKEHPRRLARAERAVSAGIDPDRSRREYADWLGRTRASYLRLLKQVNTDILKLNMMGPTRTRVQIPYRIDEEMARFDTAFPDPTGSASTTSEPARHGSLLRDSAAGRYRFDSGKKRGS